MIKQPIILLFEYFNSSATDAFYDHKMREEGHKMLFSLIQDLYRVNSFEVVVMFDPRIKQEQRDKLEKYGIKTIATQTNHLAHLEVLFEYVDLFLPIAPEKDNILYNIVATHEANPSSCHLLASDTTAIKTSSSKLYTSNVLLRQHVCAVPTFLVKDRKHCLNKFTLPVVVKPEDGFGSQGVRIIREQSELNKAEPLSMVVQPYIKGQDASMSLVCTSSETCVMAGHKQNIVEHEDALYYMGSEVDALDIEALHLQKLADNIRRAVPGLYGYIGVDFMIHPTGNITVIEINPRLTSSYVDLVQLPKKSFGEYIVEMYSHYKAHKYLS
ncbi:MAG: ATP-grasp domain-containing protein [Candidatus Oxydemutatoraceae bacterium WSBS_2016_MAG_OTU14]